ncbi:hypothetical protein CDD82_136 [Ophiocordyceps australis]|uniref:molybdopterin molybdotransferase n=1 Tax=Ophiocordyceps australis TaxID=1399860 RepID=A0A2C5YMQ0_9HYPO|nr:hypothetical protein CDD82_136 [Ophiocordyceps australis]
MDNKLTAAILVVSTTAALDASTDQTTAVLRNVLEAGQWQVVHEAIVSDDVRAVQRTIVGWCDGSSAPGLVVTTGGTGFAVADLTPEVRRPPPVLRLCP